jgi:hypothetical protein
VLKNPQNFTLFSGNGLHTCSIEYDGPEITKETSNSHDTYTAFSHVRAYIEFVIFLQGISMVYTLLFPAYVEFGIVLQVVTYFVLKNGTR